MKNIFDKLYQRYDAWYQRYPFAYLSELRAVRSVLPRKGKGVEIGVGTGRFAGPLGIRTGVDLSKKMLEIARARGIETRVGRAEDLPFPAKSFDYAALIFTLCFVKDPQKALFEACRILKSKGVLILGMIPQDSFLGRGYRKKNSIFYQHARFFTEPQVICMLKAAGFQRFRTLRTLSRPPGDMKRVEIAQKGEKGTGSFVVIQCRKTESKKRKTDEKENRI